MKCEEVEELAGAYALEALPAETLREVQEHLESCSQHPEIAGLRGVASSLAEAAPEMEPPPGLKTRLMDTVRNEAAARAATPAREAPVGWLRRTMMPRLLPYAAVALAVAVVALLAWNVYLQTSDDGVQGGASVFTLADGGTAQGRILYIPEEEVAVVTVEGLEPLTAEQTYQVWAISGDTSTGIGLFNTSEGGEASAAIDVDLADAEVVAITIEPAGGSPQPTTEPILQAKL